MFRRVTICILLAMLISLGFGINITAQETNTVKLRAGEIGMYDDIIVFTGESIVDKQGNYDIYTYNIATAETTQITEDLSNQHNPEVYKNTLIWIDGRNEYLDDRYEDVYSYDLSTNEEIKITDGAMITSIDIFEEKILWRDQSDGGIYIYDLSTKNTITIVNNTQNTYGDPDVWNDRVVWVGEGYEIYMKNITSGEITQITDISYYYEPFTVPEGDILKRHPAIYDNIIVWQDYRNDPNFVMAGWENPDLYMYNLTSEIETPVCLNESDQSFLSIYQNQIVWQDNRNILGEEPSSIGGYDVYVFDIDTNNETKLTNSLFSNTSAQNPFIYKDSIIWININETAQPDWRRSISLYNVLNESEQTISLEIADTSKNYDHILYSLIVISIISIIVLTLVIGKRRKSK